jgi:hypothetical protein
MALVGSGVVGPGKAEYFDVILTGGVTYSVYVQPSDPSVDFDLEIYDENKNLVAQDTDTTSNALCYITPRWNGPFRLLVKSAKGTGVYSIRVETAT